MDIGLREWLIIIGIIVIAAILLDGWRRIRGSRTKLRLDKNLSPFYEDDAYSKTNSSASSAAESVVFPNDELNQEVSLTENTTNKRKQIKEQQISINLESDKLSTAPTEEKSQPQKKETAQKSKPAEPVEAVLAIYVVASPKEHFKGPALLQNILESGLRFGEKDIFHRHESMTGKGELYFSMANGVKPGTFDLDDIDHFSTPAVCFFLSLPGPKHPKRAFDVMLAAARKLSSELNGELQDDQHSIMTAQTIAHYRQRIVDFERRKLRHKK